MATYTGKFKTDGKVWQTIGGVVLATPKAGTAIKGDAIVAGSDEQSYMHLTAPIVGYTKVSFLTYVMDGVTPPPPPPPAVIPAEVEIVAAKGSTVTVKDTTGKVVFSYIVP